jgi:hypothetical protein
MAARTLGKRRMRVFSAWREIQSLLSLMICSLKSVLVCPAGLKTIFRIMVSLPGVVKNQPSIFVTPGPGMCSVGAYHKKIHTIKQPVF